MINKNYKIFETWFDGRFYSYEDLIRGDKLRWEIEIDEYTVINILTEGDKYGMIYPEKERNYFEVNVVCKSEDSNGITSYSILCIPYHLVLEIIKSLKEDIIEEGI